MPYLDLVADILQRVADKDGALREDKLREIEMEVRADWGGARYYVAKLGEPGRMALNDRDDAIRKEHARGHDEAYLSLKYGIGVRRIRQILDVTWTRGRRAQGQ